MIRKDFEIMAPVGSRESLAAAIKAGADSIYFGIENLNMRSHSASTFTINDLKEMAQICEDNGLKSYLTVNTIIYGEDLVLMRQIIDAAKEAKISAVIASDVAVMAYCNKVGQEVHLSTQLNISNIEALKFYAQFADVVVLARELNLKQVREIYDQIIEQNICGPKGELIRIEMFCHGALCMAISGKCYLSLHNMNRSANRGACMQVCRRGYIVKDRESDIELEVDNKYIMSPKDLKTIRFMDELMEAGVRVLKIEGRARGPEYVHTVVSCYNEAINSVIDGTFTEEKKDAWDARLVTVFNRGFWNGYYLGQKLGEWSRHYGSEATERKVYIAKGIRYFSKIGVAEFKVEAGELNKGDKLLITGPTTGAMYLNADELRVDLKPVDKATKGQHVSFVVPDKIRPSDKLYKIVSAESLNINKN
ncbi:MAG: U32 family peptidase [Bacteroidaceae bacterium]|jgi:putative protease|nr:U32 family peptidase [Bacteroidaceae bacterium]MBQ1677598.1 U32 family peptidase [Bacteroidaceae bacterium]MBQ3875191.1 U32 family peptidase [Bacteroidaceae bacterium]MBQ5351596.1 U32 family peptidase [Bacteroidaceae bacterium]MBQ5476992.1 U32 family peptidase [Bacteroidaceae bacterium]